MSRKKLIGQCCLFAVGVLLITIWWIYYNKLNVFLTTALAWETKDRLILTGTTNLPDGTKIWMNFKAVNGKFNHMQEFEVKGGNFFPTPILYARQPPDFGDYTLILQMLDPIVQPKSVQAIIGKKGQGFRGPYTAKFNGRMGGTVRLAYLKKSYYLESYAEEAGRIIGKELGEGVVEIIKALKR